MGTNIEKAASSASTLPKPYSRSRLGTPKLSAVRASNLLIAVLFAMPDGGHLCVDKARAAGTSYVGGGHTGSGQTTEPSPRDG